MRAHVSLAQMGLGQEGVVVGIQGGFGLTTRLDSLGIRPGKTLVKTSGSYLGGPVTVKIGNAQTAVGFGMAGRIIVEVEATEEK